MKSSILPIRSLLLVTLALVLPAACASGEAEQTPPGEKSECTSADDPVTGSGPAPGNRDASRGRVLAQELAVPSPCVHRGGTDRGRKVPASRIPPEWPELGEWMAGGQSPPQPATPVDAEGHQDEGPQVR